MTDDVLRRHHPVSVTDAATVRGFREVSSVLLDPTFASAGPATSANSLLFTDGDVHHRLRRIVARFLAPSQVNALEPAMREMTGALFDDAVRSGSFDVVADVVAPVLCWSLFELFEVPAGIRAPFARLLPGMVGVLEPVAASAGQLAAMRDATMLFARVMRSGSVGGGLCDALVEARDAGEITSGQATFTPVVACHGGFENPLLFLGSVCGWAVEHPARFRDLAGDGPALTEELLRWLSPVQTVARWAPPHGPGEAPAALLVDVRSANHDPAVFDAPGEVLAGRTVRHVAFGRGPHGCPGTHLARLQARVVIDVLAAAEAGVLASGRVTARHDGLVTAGVSAVRFGE